MYTTVERLPRGGLYYTVQKAMSRFPTMWRRGRPKRCQNKVDVCEGATAFFFCGQVGSVLLFFSFIPQDERRCVNCAFAIIVDIGRVDFHSLHVYLRLFFRCVLVFWCCGGCGGGRGRYRTLQQPASQRCGVLGGLSSSVPRVSVCATNWPRRFGLTILTEYDLLHIC